MIEKIAFELEKMSSLRPWLQVSKGTRQHSKHLGTFELFLNLPYDIQNMILQKAGYESLGNLLSTSVNVNKSLKRNPRIDFDYFEQNKQYQRAKYQRFYQLVRNGTILTEPAFTGSQLTNREISELIRAVNCSARQLQLVAIPPLPNCKTLNCSGNLLTSLPDLPKCTLLICMGNRLTTLPFLPKCKRLYCVGNRLTSLPNLPKCISLHCTRNMLTTLPFLPKCIILDCRHNQLTCLPKFNDKIKTISIYTINNPLPGPLLFNIKSILVEQVNQLIDKYC
jgi:Leucine-rich repeat (LRR) protein